MLSFGIVKLKTQDSWFKELDGGAPFMKKIHVVNKNIT
jgi:hypothetical protein